MSRAPRSTDSSAGSLPASEEQTRDSESSLLRSHCLLLSGGLDSTTLAAWIQDHHPREPITAYTFLYGQKHAVELEAALAVANSYGLEHHVVELQPVRGSALTDSGTALPLGRDLSKARGTAPSYVPARNLLLLAQIDINLLKTVAEGFTIIGGQLYTQQQYPGFGLTA